MPLGMKMDLLVPAYVNDWKRNKGVMIWLEEQRGDKAI